MLQKTILESPRGIANKEEFFDNKVEHVQSLEKQTQDAILTLEPKRILWELLIPPEYFLPYIKKNWMILLLRLESIPIDAGKIFW